MSDSLMPSSHAPAPDLAVRPTFRRWLSAALLLLATSAASASPLASEEQQLANRLVRDHGQHRDSRRMVLDPVLTALARTRAADMAKRHYFSHTDPDGNGPNVLARSAGYALPSSWCRSRAENFIESIGAGQATAEAAWEAWMHSPMHRTHLLAQSSFYRDQTNFGIGFYSDPASPYRNYWVVLTAPPARSVIVSSARGAKAVRIAVASPAWTDDDADSAATAPRPSAIPMPNAAGKRYHWDEPARTPNASGKLWNWEESTDSARTRVPRPAGAG